MSDTLIIAIDAKDNASPALEKLKKNTDKLGSSFGGAGKGLEELGSRIPGISGAMASLAGGPMVAAAGAAIAVAAGLGTMVKGSIDMADNLNDMHLKLGISTERLSVLSVYANQSGTDIETLTKSMGKLGVKLASGDKDLASLGITAGTTDEALFQLSDKIASVEDPMLRLKIATDAFGKSGQDMLPLLVQGGDALRTMATNAPIVSSEFATMADNFNDNIEVLKGQWTSLSISVAESALPALMKILDVTIKIVEKAKEYKLGNVAKVAGGVATGNVGLIASGFGGGLREEDPLSRTSIDRAIGNQQGLSGVYTGESLIRKKTAQEVAAINESEKEKLEARKKAIKEAADKLQQWQDGIRNNYRKDEQKRVIDLYAGAGGTEVDVSEESYTQRAKELEAAQNARKKYEAFIIDRETVLAEERVAIWSSVAGPLEGALSQPFNNFFTHILKQNESLKTSFRRLYSDLQDSFSAMLANMLAQYLAKAAIFTAINILTGGSATGALGATSALSYIFNAKGTDYSFGGPTVVGENGPEILNLPRGSQVIPNNQISNFNSSVQPIFNIILKNESVSEVKRIVKETMKEVAIENPYWRRG